MQLSRLSRTTMVLVALGVIAVVIVGAALAIGPLTRKYVATDKWCLDCHLPVDPTLDFSRDHPAGADQPPATCAQCHTLPGAIGAIYTYAHQAYLTDLYGTYRGPGVNRGGKWIAPVARRAYRSRDGMRATDSAGCRSCHIEAEIKPKKKRGQRAHDEALEKKLTCINCHYNLVHRAIDPREGFVK